jgi:hypothetical protein
MEHGIILDATNAGRKRRTARNRILSARLSEEEYAGLERRAWENGMTVGDWARGVLLEHFRNSGPTATPTHIFTELVAIQLVMMNAFEPILRGEKLTREQIAGIFREVQATKAARAQEILLKRTRTKEE